MIDLDGVFVLENVPIGSHKTVASYLGYEVTQQYIEVKEGEPANIQFALAESATMMDQVVVTDAAGTPREWRPLPDCRPMNCGRQRASSPMRKKASPPAAPAPIWPPTVC